MVPRTRSLIPTLQTPLKFHVLDFWAFLLLVCLKIWKIVHRSALKFKEGEIINIYNTQLNGRDSLKKMHD